MTTVMLDEAQAKEWLREVLVELLEQRPSEFRQLVIEAIEDAAMINAIREGRKGEFVTEEEIKSYLTS